MICGYCDEEIGPDQPTGPFPITDGLSGLPMPLHLECQFRMVSGSVGHQKRECSCYGHVDTTEHGLTLRQAALAAHEYYLEHAIP
jgi:hypothetical protein